MRKTRVLWVTLILLAAAFAFFACGKFLKKEKPAETPITVTEKPAETPPTEAPTETPPAEAPSPYTAKTLDNLKMLDDVLGASEKTLGWDNVYCSLSLDKNVELFTTIQGSYAPGSADRNFVDASITDLTNIKTYLDEKITKAEGVDPTGADAKSKKAKIAEIRARVRAMIAGPAPKEKIPEWKGDLMKKKWKEGGDMKKKKWAERNKKK